MLRGFALLIAGAGIAFWAHGVLTGYQDPSQAHALVFSSDPEMDAQIIYWIRNLSGASCLYAIHLIADSAYGE